MAHEVETMAYTNEVPWHGLGSRITKDVNDKEFLKAAGLNWTVDLKPLKTEVEPGKLIEVPGRFALVRSKDKKIMTITGPSWQPLQNAQVLGFMEEYVKAGGAKLETAGALRGGNIVWALAKLKHSFEARKGDRVEGYLLMTSPHIVGQAIKVRTTTVRVVCANTLAMAAAEGDVNYSQNHLSAFNFDKAKERIGMAHTQLAEAERRAKILTKLKLSMEDAVKKVIVPVFMPNILAGTPAMDAIMTPEAMPARVAGIVQSITNGPGAEPGTGWGVLNGVTHWVDHVQGRDNATRMFRSWMGDYSLRKLETEEKLLQLAA